ncbi:hypothetical protein [Cryobacterium melibiosiphilum]|uniref:hypothetical protein n=1 Tax=Cryobacterium melibiosiphilum TaxID=995039 RepID=UPI0038991DDD
MEEQLEDLFGLHLEVRREGALPSHLQMKTCSVCIWRCEGRAPSRGMSRRTPPMNHFLGWECPGNSR